MTCASDAAPQGTGVTNAPAGNKDIKDKYKQFNNPEADPLNGTRVKGSLKRNIQFWKQINANQFVLDTIENGYKLPFKSIPPPKIMKNNRSALENKEFVAKSIQELIEKGCVEECDSAPLVVNPLTVSVQSNGKKRLILDLRHVNEHLIQEKFKYEDWKIALQYIEKQGYMFSFDLKSGYHHIDINSEFVQYLGFSWGEGEELKYYRFLVLAFGLSTGPRIFTKVVRPLVKFWRTKGINVVVYLDDGWSHEKTEGDCMKNSECVKNDLKSSGFIVNQEKSVWVPTQCIEWLGLVWNTLLGTLSIPERRIQSAIHTIKYCQESRKTTARKLAMVTGKIISMSPVLGNVTRIMTRNIYTVIEQRSGWDTWLTIKGCPGVNTELQFWEQSLGGLNSRSLHIESEPEIIAFSDASSVAGAAFTMHYGKQVAHRMWDSNEQQKSSTWRELEALAFGLEAFTTFAKGKTIKWFTDCQNVERITQVGSKKPELQEIALRIFQNCVKNAIQLDVQWVPRSKNEEADMLSRIVDFEDWGLSQELWEGIQESFGPHTVDRFANHKNAKLHRFNSKYWNPGAEAIDAFTQNWGNSENNLLVPLYL